MGPYFKYLGAPLRQADNFSALTEQRPAAAAAAKGSQFTCLYPTENNLQKLNSVKTIYLKNIMFI